MKSKIQILQLTNTPENRYYKFTGLDMLKSEGMEPSLDRYETVYEYEQEMPTEQNEIIEQLDVIYSKFQGMKPEGYKGHSLSVSDIIKVDDTCFYVDDYGFEKIF